MLDLEGSSLHTTYMLLIPHKVHSIFILTRLYVTLCHNILHLQNVNDHCAKSSLMIRIMIKGVLAAFYHSNSNSEIVQKYLPCNLPNYGYSNNMSGYRIDSSPFLPSKKIDEHPSWERLFPVHLFKIMFLAKLDILKKLSAKYNKTS